MAAADQKVVNDKVGLRELGSMTQVSRMRRRLRSPLSSKDSDGTLNLDAALRDSAQLSSDVDLNTVDNCRAGGIWDHKGLTVWRPLRERPNALPVVTR
jgi:hypothetical protein